MLEASLLWNCGNEKEKFPLDAHAFHRTMTKSFIFNFHHCMSE